jgi:hypothetical protein
VAEAAPSQSLLPRKTRVAGRAEVRRRHEANLVPLDESPAVPLDRTPYLRLDVIRVVTTSLVMVVVILLGWIFIR